MPTMLRGARINYARVCVEVDVSKPLLDEFKLDILSKESPSALDDLITIKVTYQWRPPVCSHCDTFGHTLEKCHKLEKVNNSTILGAAHRVP